MCAWGLSRLLWFLQWNDYELWIDWEVNARGTWLLTLGNVCLFFLTSSPLLGWEIPGFPKDEVWVRLACPQQRGSDRTEWGRGHWPLTVINKYLLQPSVRWGPADNVCRHISVYKALGWKETEWKEACAHFACFSWSFLRILLLKQQPYILI